LSHRGKKLFLQKIKKIKVILWILASIIFIGTNGFAVNNGMIWNGPEDKRVVALTFDDGPSITGSPAILDILDKYGVKATFFVIGGEIIKDPDSVFRMDDSGHDVGNHFHSNKRLKDIPYKDAVSGINQTNNSIFSVIGKWPDYFRPPGGKCPDYLSDYIKSKNMKVIGWTINAEDYTEFTEGFEIEKNYKEIAESLTEKVLEEVTPGAIVLLHNGSKQTIMALPKIIDGLRKKGYGFVTISELLGDVKN